MRTLIAIVVALMLAAPAWAGVAVTFKPDPDATLPVDMCIYIQEHWDGMSEASKAACPVFHFQIAETGEDLKFRNITPKGAALLIPAVRLGLARIRP